MSTRADDRQDVQAFLDRLGRALTSGDSRMVATMWEVPALVVGDEMLLAVSSREQIEAFFGGAKAQYVAQGVVDTRADIERLEWPTSRIAVVDVRWPYLDAAGREVGAERSTYTLRRGEGGALRLCVALMRGAQPAA